VDLEPDVAWGLGDLSNTLGIPKEKIRIVSPYIGGGFGGKGTIQSPMRCWRLSRAQAGRPVKVTLQRAHAEQHDASRRDHPAYPHRRNQRRQDHRHRPRKLVGQYAQREAGTPCIPTRLLYAGATG
jgi:xanthine dehydrogenase YagR molybdenum-binding subunit